MAKPAAMAPIETFLALVGLALLLSTAGPAAAQEGACPCPPDLCCSQWNYCGNTAAYCGEGCSAGPCYNTPPAARAMASGAKAVGSYNRTR